MKPLLSAFVFVSILSGSSLLAQNPVSGAEVYQKHCASCHDQVSARIPTRDAIQKMSSSRILRTLDFGLMMSIAYPLKRDEREAVARFLGTTVVDAPPPKDAFCGEGKMAMAGSPNGNWPGWSPSSNNARFQSASQMELTSAEVT